MRVWSTLSRLEQAAVVLKAHQDPLLLQDYFNVVLRPKQAEVVRQFYAGQYCELVAVAGMRGGKTFLLAYFGCVETFYALTRDYRKLYGLAPNRPLFVLLVSAGEEQAEDTLFAEVEAVVESSDLFQSFSPRMMSGKIEFTDKKIIVEALSSNSATGVGRTSKAVCIDELGKFERTEGKRGAKVVYDSLTRSTRSLGSDGHRFIAGSPWEPDDTLMKVYEIGKSIPSTLPVQLATWELNPQITRESLADEFARDPLAAERDYGANPMSSTDVYYRNPEIVRIEDERVNVLEALADGVNLKGEPGIYAIAGDPALKHDAFGLALAHRQLDGVTVVDGVFRFVPEREIDPLEVRSLVVKTVDLFPVQVAVFDTWSYPELQQALEMRGVRVVNHVVKKEHHDRVKEMFYNKQLAVCRAPVLRRELEQLRVYSSRQLDHPRGGSKDVADSVANVVWALENEVQQVQVPVRLVEVI